MTITRLPWQLQFLVRHRDTYEPIITDTYQQELICEGFKTPFRSEEEAEANAAFIVKAVNMHSELVEILENMMNAIDSEFGKWRTDINFPNARAILAKAK